MAVDFRGHPMFRAGFNSPTRFEADVYDCEVWGQIPSDIDGTFYRRAVRLPISAADERVAHGLQRRWPRQRVPFLERLRRFEGKYVKTERLMAERKARKRLWGVYRNHFTDDPQVANIDRGAANTHIYWHGGKMIVLKEDSLPYHIDPFSLETIGR